MHAKKVVLAEFNGTCSRENVNKSNIDVEVNATE